ncbi:TolC family outer membrane protein [Marinobacterium litorale]|uniref:TolC family outer membrane protein n=1 Tax=Marinobacterium litorale TaxID=404770 RepID=UPI0004848CAA|nr:TolC family outer membrane protein [Marinobacterium litorale]
MKAKPAYLLFGLLSTVSVAAAEPAAVEAGASGLLELYQQAKENDTRILAAEANKRAGEYQQREALGRLLPQVNADARGTRTRYESGPFKTYYYGERYSFSAQQVLFDIPAWRSYQRFKALSEQSGLDAQDRIADATVDLVQRYFEVLAAQDSLELVQAEKRVVSRNLERVTTFFEKQLAPVTEKLETEARLDRLRADEIEASNRVEVAREALAEVLGRPIYEQLKRLKPEPRLPERFELGGFEHWRDEALASSTLIASRQAAVEAQRASMKQASGGHYPTLSLSVTGQKSNIGYENSQSGRTQSGVLALNLSVPIYSGGSTEARSDAEYERLVVAQQELEGARREVLKEVRTAYMNAGSAVSRIEATKVALRSSERAREAAEKSFTYGVNNVIDVLDRTREEYSAKRDLLEAQYSFLISHLVLQRWAGLLGEEDIVAIDETLTADADPVASR